LAQKDLEIRGPGQLMGTRQAGISDVAMEALGNSKLLETITKEAQLLLDQSPDLSAYPLLKKEVAHIYGSLHME
jgi:ATP-dependent DNA helicase RecG